MKKSILSLTLFAISLIIQAQIIIATTDAPYEMQNEQGQLIDLDVSIMNAIVTNQNMNIVVVSHSWSSIFDDLNAGRKDIITSVIITEERKKQMDFFIPHILPIRTVYLKPEVANHLGIRTFLDLDKGTIAERAATTRVSALESFFGKNSSNTVSTTSQYITFKVIMADEVSSIFGDTLVLNYHSSFIPNANLVILDQPPDASIEAFCYS